MRKRVVPSFLFVLLIVFMTPPAFADASGCSKLHNPVMEMVHRSVRKRAVWRLVEESGVLWEKPWVQIQSTLAHPEISVQDHLLDGLRLKIVVPREDVTFEMGIYYDMDFGDIYVWFIDGYPLPDRKHRAGDLTDSSETITITIPESDYRIVSKNHFEGQVDKAQN